MNGMPSAPSQKSIALCRVEPTMVMWCSPWTWILFVTASPFPRSVRVPPGLKRGRLQRCQIPFQPRGDSPHRVRLGVGHIDPEAGDQGALPRIASADDAPGEAGRAEQHADAQLRAAETALHRE